MSWFDRRRVGAIATMTAGLVLAAGPAQAWYVDISITGGGRVYETTDANELDEHCPDTIEGFASPGNTPTGAVGATCQAGSADGDYGHGWVVRYVAEAAPGYTFDGWHSDGRTNPGPVLCDGSGGSSNYSGAACQFATFQNLQIRARFVDSTAPSMSSLAGPTGPVNGPATFTFSAAADPTFRLFECRVATVHEWQTCASGRQENPSTSGTYTFEVRAVDHSGNRSTASTWAWTVDKVAPETHLDGSSGPSGLTASTSATFNFSGSTDVVGYRCTLDGVTTNCTSPKSYAGLAPGSHAFAVYAIDDAGNVDASPASRTWTVDTVAPETTIAEGPTAGSTSSSQSASFAFGSTEPGTFECQLDGGAWTVCESPRALGGLSEGTHTFGVRARDAVGNVDATPATRSWTVDLVDVPVVLPPPTTTTPPAPAPDTSVATMQVRSKFRHRVSGGLTTVRTLKLTRLPAGAAVRVTCRGKGCAFKAKRLKASESSVTLTKLFKGRKLSAGAVIQMRITASGYEPTTFRYKMRKGSKAPSGGEVAGRLLVPTAQRTLSTPWAPRSASLMRWLTNG